VAAGQINGLQCLCDRGKAVTFEKRSYGGCHEHSTENLSWITNKGFRTWNGKYIVYESGDSNISKMQCYFASQSRSCSCWYNYKIKCEMLTFARLI